ncbi:hypothetical protein GCM10023152_25920 [Agromyces bauzanensis]|uniref:Uncharacterized protein n=1 Tax=Agromyces bauzanensis TaxID=1308924 RepID=A0A917PQW0_9MICO|nr:hypothetical protein GCM10011372_29060 [Agromyces bauzanensis]
MDLLLRSTSVPIADRPIPMIRSPSQCPGDGANGSIGGTLGLPPLDHSTIGRTLKKGGFVLT